MSNNIKMLSGVNLRQLKQFIKESGYDGHTIWKASMFTDMGFDYRVLPVSTYESDTSNPKATIFARDGSIIPKVEGVYSLSFLRRLASALNVPQSNKIGRGFEAQELSYGKHGILAKLNAMTKKPSKSK
jgi:hypothetical protein